MRKSIITVLAALSVSGLAATPAQAEELSVTVSYADLNLATEAGAAALGQRIASAVDAVCARPHLRQIKAMAAWEKCKAEALAGAKEAVAASDKLRPVELALRF